MFVFLYDRVERFLHYAMKESNNLPPKQGISSDGDGGYGWVVTFEGFLDSLITGFLGCWVLIINCSGFRWELFHFRRLSADIYH
jgi:hypothetical protein